MNAVTKLNPNQRAVADALKSPVGASRSEATNIEQSRAIAEVQAMVVVAQRVPRNVHAARDAVRASCSELGLAEQAFFKFPRGGQTVSGESIHLAVELARCWGNINYGISELARNDDAAQSEMLAFAWDVQTNTRAMTSFIVPHKRDKKGGAEVLTDMRDVYENNANMGARRLREMIFRVIPKWLTAEAANLCHETLTKGDDTPLAERVKIMVEAFEKIGVSRAQVETKIGAKVAQFTPMDVAHLRVSYQSIRRGEVTTDEEFPVTAANAVTEALQPSEGGNPTVAPDASGGAQIPISQATPSEATPKTVGDLLDKMPTFDAADAAQPILAAIDQMKTPAAAKSYLATTAAADMAKIREAAPDLWTLINSKATKAGPKP
jgi:hypothetical protein